MKNETLARLAGALVCASAFFAPHVAAQTAAQPAQPQGQQQGQQTGSGITLKTASERVFEPTAAIPVFKIRQGEQFKLFDGIGGGVRYAPWAVSHAGQPQGSVYFSGLVMLSNKTLVDKTDPSISETVNILSYGIVFGYDWFQIGYGRDWKSSQTKAIFDGQSKDFIMLNLSGKITFQ
jgi:hypothetical protein